MLHLGLSGGVGGGGTLTVPKGHTFCSDQQTLSYLLYSSVWSISYAENDGIERKGRTEKFTVPFPFSLSLLINRLKGENVGSIRAYQEVK